MSLGEGLAIPAVSKQLSSATFCAEQTGEAGGGQQVLEGFEPKARDSLTEQLLE